MRPRLQDRGDVVPMSGRNLQVDASMRPRLQDRGDHCSRFARIWNVRSFNAATAPRPWRSACCMMPFRDAHMLQCGHGSKTVEMIFDLTIAGYGQLGFNAATAPRPWRWVRRSRLRRPERPGFNAATAPRPWRYPPVAKMEAIEGASMRPRLQDRGDN